MVRKDVEFIMEVEGLELKPYQLNGITHIGYGRNLDDVGISESEARFLLINDIQKAILNLTDFFGLSFFSNLPGQVRIVLVSMVYNLGFDGFLKFKKFIEAIKNGNYEKAIFELKNSKRAKQLPNRTQKEIELLKELL